MLAIMKGCSSIGAIFVLIIGVGILGITLYGFFHQQLFFNDTNVRNTVLGVLVVADVIIILGAVMGIYGIKKGKPGCICLFQVLVLIFFFIFLGFAIAVLVIPGIFFEGDCSTSKNSLIQSANRAYLVADVSFCRSCNCALTSYAVQNGGYSSSEQLLMRGLLYNSSYGGFDGIKAISFQFCPDVRNQTSDVIAIMGALSAIEKSLKCSGWCNNGLNLIYKFSDVNMGRPESFCYETMKDSFQKYGSVIGYGLIGVSIFLFLICTCNICLCCHPQRKNLPFSSRFAYQQANYTQIRH